MHHFVCFLGKPIVFCFLQFHKMTVLPYMPQKNPAAVDIFDRNKTIA